MDNSMAIEEEEESFYGAVFQKNGILSRWGIRASSLNDVIRYMIYMRFKLEVINKVCDEITTLYKMDKQIAYKVFKETEDEFTIRGYIQEKKKVAKARVESGERLGFVFSKLFEFLGPVDGAELTLLDKRLRKELREKFTLHVLRTYKLTQEVRVQAWLSLLDEVSPPFTLATVCQKAERGEAQF
jgi:hypothetical protein